MKVIRDTDRNLTLPDSFTVRPKSPNESALSEGADAWGDLERNANIAGVDQKLQCRRPQ